MKLNDAFIEVDFCQEKKAGNLAAGDVFESRRMTKQGRIICTLADGLGSGIKANVLATLASTMSVEFVSSEIDIKRSAEIIMRTLPQCNERKIGYSTFSIVDIRSDGRVSVIEYENPSFLLIRKHGLQVVKKEPVRVDGNFAGNGIVYFSHFKARLGDKLVICSDGVTQSGRGRDGMKFGWGEKEYSEFVAEKCSDEKEISARMLARKVIKQSLRNDDQRPQDDMSCAVINVRSPQKMLVVTGPASEKRFDPYAAELTKRFEGKKIICGGTTANIIARELGAKVKVDLSGMNRDLPPVSSLRGFDLVTEGILTLTKAVELLEAGYRPEEHVTDAATLLIDSLLDSDIIEFLVGTKLNQAHHMPDFPLEMDIRRNVVKRMIKVLRDKYMKVATMQLI